MAKLHYTYRPPQGVPGISQPVSPLAPRDPRDSAPEEKVIDRWWFESSFDLCKGLEVDENAGDTVPGELFDEMFHRRR